MTIPIKKKFFVCVLKKIINLQDVAKIVESFVPFTQFPLMVLYCIEL